MFVFGLSVFFFRRNEKFDDCEIFLFIANDGNGFSEKPQNSSVFCTLRTKRERERERERETSIYI